MDDITQLVDRRLGKGYFIPHPEPAPRVIVRVPPPCRCAAEVRAFP